MGWTPPTSFLSNWWRSSRQASDRWCQQFL